MLQLLHTQIELKMCELLLSFSTVIKERCRERNVENERMFALYTKHIATKSILQIKLYALLVRDDGIPIRIRYTLMCRLKSLFVTIGYHSFILFVDMFRNFILNSKEISFALQRLYIHTCYECLPHICGVLILLLRQTSDYRSYTL